MNRRAPATPRLCSIDGCGARHEGRGFCAKHLQRWRKHGDPHRVDVDWDTDRRFHSKHLVTNDGCWEWQGRDVNQFGHARWVVRGVRVGVHRWAYERFVGPIPAGLVLDHLCRNPCCVNPAHLEPVEQRDNVLRAPTAPPAINARKTHCVHGHELSGYNIMRAFNAGRPSRRCRTCHNRRVRESLLRRRAELSA